MAVLIITALYAVAVSQSWITHGQVVGQNETDTVSNKGGFARDINGTFSTETTDTRQSSSGATLPGPDVCGKLGADIRKVVGGTNADLGQFPWIAALGYMSPPLPGLTYECGGSLVTDKHVVTAAHCLVGIRHLVLTVVRLGDLDLNDTIKDDATPTDYEVDSWITHPEYKTSGNVNDIGIVTLKDIVTYTRLIKPICLPTLDVFKTKDFKGYAPYIAGWGATIFKGPKITRLQQVQVEVVDHQACKEAYLSKRRAVIDNRVLCAGVNGQDACRGDSGGPLMMPRGRRGTFYLFGVVSYGYKCARPGYPGVYTRVAQFLDWILLNLN